VALGQQQPATPRVFHEPSACLHKSSIILKANRKLEERKPLNRMYANPKLSQQRGSPQLSVPETAHWRKYSHFRWKHGAAAADERPCNIAHEERGIRVISSDEDLVQPSAKFAESRWLATARLAGAAIQSQGNARAVGKTTTSAVARAFGRGTLPPAMRVF